MIPATGSIIFMKKNKIAPISKKRPIRRKAGVTKATAPTAHKPSKKAPIRRKLAVRDKKKKVDALPFDLTPAAMREWTRLSFFRTAANESILALYCAAVGRAVDANNSIAYIARLKPGSGGFILQSKGGQWQGNPAVKSAQDADLHALAFAKQIGLIQSDTPPTAKPAGGDGGIKSLPGWNQ